MESYFMTGDSGKQWQSNESFKNELQMEWLKIILKRGEEREDSH